MTVARPRRERPSSVEEVVRVTQIFNLLADFADARFPVNVREQTRIEHFIELLELAERIAARTED